MKFPQVKKKLKSFLREEDGRMPKGTIMKIGSILTILGISIYDSKVVSGHSSGHTNNWKKLDQYSHKNMLSIESNSTGEDTTILMGTHSHNAQRAVNHTNNYSDSG